MPVSQFIIMKSKQTKTTVKTNNNKNKQIIKQG